MKNWERAARQLVCKEAYLMDLNDWNSFLDLYTDDGEIWAPMWKDESTLNDDPFTELSFIYLHGKEYIKERVDRIRSGMAVALMPVARVSHLLGVVDANMDEEKNEIVVRSSWVSNVYRHKDRQLVSYAGRYEHRLEPIGDEVLIKNKKIIVINDQLRSEVEFYYF